MEITFSALATSPTGRGFGIAAPSFSPLQVRQTLQRGDRKSGLQDPRHSGFIQGSCTLGRQKQASWLWIPGWVRFDPEFWTRAVKLLVTIRAVTMGLLSPWEPLVQSGALTLMPIVSMSQGCRATHLFIFIKGETHGALNTQGSLMATQIHFAVPEKNKKP